MLILVDNREQRSRLIESIRRRIDEEIEQVAAEICDGGTAERPLRRLRTLMKMLASVETGLTQLNAFPPKAASIRPDERAPET